MSARIAYHPGLRAAAYRREKTGDGFGHKSVPDGFIVGDVEIEIDQHLLLRLAHRALGAKSKRAVVGNGVLVAKARNVRKEP